MKNKIFDLPAHVIIFLKHYSPPHLFLVIFTLAGQFFSTHALAQWSTDSTINNPICTTVTEQQVPRIVTDGSGGAIITWWDYNQLKSDYNIYAQRINSAGIIQWTVNGIAICTDTLHQHNPEMTSDGNGGAIIVWQDNRSGTADIYAQRINGNGLVQWAANGIPVCAAIHDQTQPQLISDGSGGAIITWRDLRGGTNYVPYAQKLNAFGVGQWTPDGVLLSATGIAEGLQIINDGKGGAMIAWHQYNTGSGEFDIYAQHIYTNGILGWGSNGIAPCSFSGNQLRPEIISDGANGAIIAWEDYRNTTYSNLYTQRVDSAGVIQWAADGVNIAPNTISQIRHKLLSDGSNGMYITWQYGNNLVYAQRLNSAGTRQWANDGVSIGGAGDSRFPQIATDGGTGAIITWYDYRGSGNGDVFAQHINLGGSILWVLNGVSICRDPSGQEFPRIVADAGGGAIITWEDDRNDVTNSLDIYAQHINSTGLLGIVTGINEFKKDNSMLIFYPNPFTNEILIQGTKQNGMITIYDVSGKEIIKQNTFNMDTKISTEKLFSGSYLINYSIENKTVSNKLVKL